MQDGVGAGGTVSGHVGDRSGVGGGRGDIAPGVWAVLIPADRYEAERLYHHDVLELTGLEVTVPAGPRPGSAGPAESGPGSAGPAGSAPDGRPRPGDEVLVLGGDPPHVVALGRVAPPGDADAPDPDEPQPAGPGTLVVTYTRRSFDEPVPAGRLALDGPVTRLDPATYRSLAAQIRPPGDQRTWLVSLDLPIEASSPAEAVRQFWSYVMELGPRDLPAYISPYGNELAMQAFVLGVEANQDPEEDD